MIDFHPLTLDDQSAIRDIVRDTECRNCDLNFMNLASWRFLYDTETAIHDGWLVFRFKANGHLAYQAPVGKGDCRAIMHELLADAEAQGQPFLMLGVCEHVLTSMDTYMPDYFYATADRSYADYIYTRESLATLAGKRLQPKRNFANRFTNAYPDYAYEPLTPGVFDECLRLEETWSAQKPENSGRLTYADEKRSMRYVLDHWDRLDGTGGAIRVDGKLVAFTFGAPINYDTFDVCVEKADTAYEGAYAVINRDFVRHIPEQYTYINREEDLGIEGLRHAKLSYHPAVLLQKYTVMTKHPLGNIRADL